MSFASDIEKWAKKTKLKPNEVKRATFLDLSRQIMTLTPVDTGRARGNWIPSLNQPKTRALHTTDNFVMTRVENVLSKEKADDTLYLMNNLPYIWKLEYGGYGPADENVYGPTSKKTIGGYSIQAPNGMVRVTVQNFRKALKKAVKGVQ